MELVIVRVCVLVEEKKANATLKLNVSENHNLLYFNIPKEIVDTLNITEKDALEYDIRGSKFFIRKKGSINKPLKVDKTIFEGLRVDRTITRNNTILRTNLPKEVAQPLTISKGDTLELLIEDKVIIGKKYNIDRYSQEKKD